MTLNSFKRPESLQRFRLFFGLFKKMEYLHSHKRLTSHKSGTLNVLVDLKRLVVIINLSKSKEGMNNLKASNDK